MDHVLHTSNSIPKQVTDNRTIDLDKSKQELHQKIEESVQNNITNKDQGDSLNTHTSFSNYSRTNLAKQDNRYEKNFDKSMMGVIQEYTKALEQDNKIRSVKAGSNMHA